MNRLTQTALTLGLLSSLSGLLLADIPVEPRPPQPKPAPKDAVPIVATVDADATHSRLVIPAQYVQKNGKGRSAVPTSPKTSDASPVSLRTIVAGLAMSLAIGGVFFLRRGGKARVLAWLAVGTGVTFGLAPQLIANLAPLPPEPEPTKVVIEISQGGTGVQLILDRQTLSRLMLELGQLEGPEPVPPGVGVQPEPVAPPAAPKSTPAPQPESAPAPQPE